MREVFAKVINEVRSGVILKKIPMQSSYSKPRRFKAVPHWLHLSDPRFLLELHSFPGSHRHSTIEARWPDIAV